MKSPFSLPTIEKKEEYIQKNFNEIAPYYDIFNDLFTFGMHRSWKVKLLKFLNLKDAETMIDLCSGSGDIALYATKQGKHLKIVACDFSEEMLKILNKRVELLNLKDRIEIKKYNVLKLPKSFTSKFDVATVGYGVRNVKDRIQFFKEVYRVLKKKGKFGILEVGEIKPSFLEPIAHFFMKYFIPLIGWILHRKKHPMYQYLPYSALAFPEPEQIVQELNSVGFKNITFYRVFFGASILYIAHKES
ncbi:MAG: ubiquinone/menaquinone biosynthesis methyltransferase [Leptonema sp. (in: bacteria)]